MSGGGGGTGLGRPIEEGAWGQPPRVKQEALEAWKIALSFAFETLKGSLLINGAGATASIALLASSNLKNWSARMLASGALLFCTGLLLATCALGIAFFAQERFAQEAELWAALSQRQSAVRLGAASIIAFALGVISCGLAVLR